MFKVAKERKVLMLTIFLLSAIQIPQYALTTGIDLLSRKFGGVPFAMIQTVVLSPSLLAAVGGVVSALLIRWHKITKKSAVIIGVSLVAVTGVLALVFHTAFWQLIVFSVFIGMGMGFFIPSSVSIMFDSFEERERQLVSGITLSFVNGGCILMAVLAGLLFTLVWYGGYIVMLLALPILIMSAFAIPKDKRTVAAAGERTKRKATKLPADVYYYSALAFVFMLIYTVTNSNLAPHLATSAIRGDSATAGLATGVMMGGGIVAGAVFPKCSPLLKDHMITLSFLFVFIGFTLLNFFKDWLLVDFAAVFIVGMTVSMIIPQCMFNISNVVDETNSSTSTMLFSSIAPGTAGFLSSIIFTPLTEALGNRTTEFRFQFVGIVSLALAALIFLNTVRRARKKGSVKAEQVQ
jgi:MFS family permease